MTSKFLPVLLVAVATCVAQQCQPQPACCCAQQPSVIQMTCGGGLPSHVPAPQPPPPFFSSPPPPPPPSLSPAFTTTWAPTEPPTTALVADTDAETCNKDGNLVIVMASLLNINFRDPSNYNSFPEFAVKLASAWKKNPANGVSVVVYNNKAELLFGLDQGRQMDEATLQHTIMNADYPQTGQGADYGLYAADHELYVHSPNNMAKSVLWITDGTSDHSEYCLEAAQQLEASGTKLVAVGVGRGRNMRELNYAVNNPAHVFSVENFDELKEQDFLSKMIQVLC